MTKHLDYSPKNERRIYLHGCLFHSFHSWTGRGIGLGPPKGGLLPKQILVQKPCPPGLSARLLIIKSS